MRRTPKTIREAGATQNGKLVAKCRVPRGTNLVEAEIDDTNNRVLFIYKVEWWAVPWYLFNAVAAMLREGMSYHVWVDKMQRPAEPITLTEQQAITEPTRQVH